MNTLLISPFAYRIRPNTFPTRFNRLVDQFVAQDSIPAIKRIATRIPQPATNIKKTEFGYELLLSVPGYVKEQINISTDQDMLLVEGETQSTTTEDKVTYREFELSKIKRSFKLPENVDYEKISAVCKDGILAITIGLKAEKASKATLKITVE